jgi:protein phosphatase 1 regulatory subunit 7
LLRCSNFIVKNSARADPEEREPEKEERTVTIDPGALDVDLNHCGLRRIERLEELTQVESLCLRQNYISKIEGLETLTTLTDLDLYDNRLARIESLDNLTNLT